MRVQSQAYRQSVNSIIQGTGAFMTNLSIVLVREKLKELNMESICFLTVHDSLVLDCKPEEVDQVAFIVKTIMENLPIEFLFMEYEGERIRFPIGADVEIGWNYNDLVDYEPELFKEIGNLPGYLKYLSDLKNVKNHKNADMIPKDKAEEISDKIKQNKLLYKNVS